LAQVPGSVVQVPPFLAQVRFFSEDLRHRRAYNHDLWRKSHIFFRTCAITDMDLHQEEGSLHQHSEKMLKFASLWQI